MKRILVGLALVSLAACHKEAPKQQPKPAPAPVAPAPKPVAAVAPAAPVKPPPLDPTSTQVVLARLHAIDAQESDLAMAAKKSAKSKSAKALAAQVASSRTKLDADVTALAKKLNVPLSDPAKLNLPDADQKDVTTVSQELSNAKAKSGAEFDRAFFTAIDDADKRESAMLTSEAAKSKAAEIQALAKREGTTLAAQEKVAERDMAPSGKHR